MPEKKIPDLIQEIFDKNERKFMTVNQLVTAMSSSLKRKLGIKSGQSAASVKKILEPLVQDKFIFHKKGSVLYILIPCDPAKLVMSAFSESKGIGAASIAKSLPFSKSEIASIINNLFETGTAAIKFDGNLDAKIFLSDKKITPAPEPEPEITKTTDNKKIRKKSKYTPDEFMKAFEKLDTRQFFVKIPALRKKLNWPRDEFDNILIELRNNQYIQLHIADESIMTQEEIEDCFIDENNYRMGTITKNVR